MALEVAFRSRRLSVWQEGIGRNGRDSMALNTSCCLSSRPMSMYSTGLKASPGFGEDCCTAWREVVEKVDLS